MIISYFWNFIKLMTMNRILSEQERQRRHNLKEIEKLGINPFPSETFKVNVTAADIHKNYERDKLNYKDISIAGRIMSRRVMGNASFIELQDKTGRVQAYIRRDDICPGEDKTLYNTVFKKLLDIGDIVGLEGYVFTTKTGTISIHVEKLTLLSKAIRPLPIVKEAEGKTYDAFSDPEQRYRMRYVDLIVNSENRETFVKRTKLINAMRQYFNDYDYLEVETPVLQPIPGGAAAKPFITHHNALDTSLYLRIANELYLKRLIVGGFEGVYEFSKNFRNEGMDRTHNPEFTVMEIYVAYTDYHWMMNFTEKLLEHCAIAVNGSTQTQFGEHQIDWKAPYPRISMRDAIIKYTGFDIQGKSEDEIRQAAIDMGIEIDDTMGKGKLIDEIFGEKCEGNFIQPTFITEYPIEMSPLNKKHRTEEGLTERFELMVCGKEIANAYSELNDPIDQRERFEEQLKLSEKGDDEAMFIDQDFLRALEFGMPPTSGLGIGMDRLLMFLTNTPSIQEVLFFPQMRPEKKKVELNEDAKMVFELLKKEEKMTLEDLKNQANLSNKKWDKAIKELTQKKLAKVEKTEESLFVEIQ